jgi:REP element-mobilizing transposase RayT
MLYYRRRLPHWVPDSSILFITWRLAGSLPAPRADLRMPQHGAPVPFVQQDERLARSSFGPFWLRDPRVASMVQQALRYGETPHNLYFLHAWVILPNHVHVILQPRLALPEIMRWLKGRTGRKANQILGRRGQPFWQDESYDHWVRTTKELHELIRYVENNPVQAGLVAEEAQWPWSSARMRADDTLLEADDELRSSAPRELLQK